MHTITAKVFKAGNSQALRLPRSLGVTAKTYEVTPTADGFMVVDPAARAKRLRALDKLVRLPVLSDEWPRPR
jgi:virulence-associated protein VagC